MMELFLNTAITLSFFSIVASLIWLVWDQREIALKAVVTALIVLVALMMCKLGWYGLR